MRYLFGLECRLLEWDFQIVRDRANAKRRGGAASWEIKGMRIRHVRIRDMWSFRATDGDMEDLGQTAVIIGKNNSGKSNILRTIHWFKENHAWLKEPNTQGALPKAHHHDYGGTGTEAHPSLELEIELSDSEVNESLELASEYGIEARELPFVREDITQGCILACAGNWPHVNAVGQSVRFADAPAARHAHLKLRAEKDHKLVQLRGFLCDLVNKKTCWLPGWRKLEDKTSYGSSYIETLSNLKTNEGDPEDARDERENFVKIQTQFQKLTDLVGAELEPLPGKRTLRVIWRGRYLEIESFGDGIRHLLMMSIEFTLHEGWVFLIEEPETHLHPELQRRLVDMMRANPQNQYIITTHSPVLLDAAAAKSVHRIEDAQETESVHRIEYDGNRSTIKRCETTNDLYRVLDLLDVRASDLLQANCVIWVEGPTDRMFLNRCLDLLEAPFDDGIHYLFAFYGGSLRAHVTVDEAQPLVNLMRLSRHVVMVCDSDRSNAEDGINDAKERLQREFGDIDGLYWITAGREIENYLPDTVLNAAYTKLLGKGVDGIKLGRYEKLGDKLQEQFPKPQHGDGWKVAYGENKVKIMPLILEHLNEEDLDRFDLTERLTELIAHIENANGPSAVGTEDPQRALQT